jgi:hypothetical protein
MIYDHFDSNRIEEAGEVTLEFIVGLSFPDTEMKPITLVINVEVFAIKASLLVDERLYAGPFPRGEVEIAVKFERGRPIHVYPFWIWGVVDDSHWEGDVVVIGVCRGKR